MKAKGEATTLTKEQLARYIDHTLLKPQATAAQVASLCHEAVEHEFYSVCVNPYWVRTASSLLEGSPVLVCTVAGFPLGATVAAAKAHEAAEAVRQGAREVDIVINLGALKSGDWRTVEADISAVVREVEDVPVKVILETCYLTDEEKVRACQVVRDAGARFVKTSTGFGEGGATVHDVQLMRRTVGPKLGVKAAGGIRTLSAALAMISAGADRLGTSASVAIMREMDAGRGHEG